MSDDAARALGAGGSTIKIGEKECQIRPLGIRELVEVERECLIQYKRSFLKTFTDNADLIPENMRESIISAKMDEAARWDISDLPTKIAYDTKSVELTKQLKDWLKRKHELNGKTNDKKLRALCTAELDSGGLTPEEYKSLSVRKANKGRVPYVNWWITGSFEGMITFVWTCFKPSGVTKSELIDGLKIDSLADVAREIEKLSAPAVGNG